MARHGRLIGPPAAQDSFGRKIKIVQQLALPAIPDVRTHGAYIGHGQNVEEAQALYGADFLGKLLDRAGVGDIPLLRRLAHFQMVAHKPGHKGGLCFWQTQTPGGAPGGLFTLHLLIAFALARIMKKHGQHKRAPVFDLSGQCRGEGVFFGLPATEQITDHFHGLNGVLIHCELVVHIELGLADDCAKFRDQPGQNAGLIHQSQRRAGIGVRQKQIHEGFMGNRIRLERASDFG